MYHQLKRKRATHCFKADKNDGCPFNVKFKGEGGQDYGGPRRDALNNICKELMSEILPFFVRTSNNITARGKNADMFQLNPTLSG